MILTSLTLNNFKNIEEATLTMSPKVNCLLGDNGMGKSNLLDAIYFLSMCRSMTGAPDAMLIRRGEDWAMMHAKYLRHASSPAPAEDDLQIGLQRGRRKSVKRGGKTYAKLSEHIGMFPLVLVSPADMDLVSGSGEERRKFMDIVISQTDARYLDAVIRYDQALEQRNRLLRDEVSDPNLYLAIEMQMEAAAEYISDRRRQWTQTLSRIFQPYYASIADPQETASLAYTGHLAQPGTRLSDVLSERRTRDAALHYTSAGPHRDDIEMMLDGMPVRRTASQGQAKTYTLALRLAQYEFLKQASGLSPLLLLDDIFDKLDSTRVERIMSIVAHPSFGQIFITDTNRKHIDEILAHTSGPYSIWHVHNGIFSPSDSAS